MPGKRLDRKMQERRIFMAHASGLCVEEIARTEGMGAKGIRRILARAGVDTEAISKQGRKQMPKKQVNKRDFEELWEQSTRNLEVLCGREFRQQLDAGEVERIAAERGLLYQDAFASVQDEAYRPLTEATESRQEAKRRAVGRTLEADEERVDKQAREYAERRGVSYPVALEAVLPNTEPAETATSEAPLRTGNATEEAISLEAEIRARREGCSFEAALDAVLAERS